MSARNAASGCVVALACLAGTGDASSAAVHAEDAPELVACYLTWHATAHGSGHTAPDVPGQAPEQFRRRRAEMVGSAVTRYQQVAGKLVYHDTRYLRLVVRDELQVTDIMPYPYGGNCTIEQSENIFDATSYSGSRVPAYGQPLMLFPEPPQQTDHGTVLKEPFNGLVSMTFDVQRRTQEHGNAPHVACNEAHNETRRDSSVLTELASDPRLEMVAGSSDLQSFSMHMHFRYQDNGGVNDDVEWIAPARCMGKCAGHAAPVQDGDPVVTDEEVEVCAAKPEIDPDGKTDIEVSVTC